MSQKWDGTHMSIDFLRNVLQRSGKILRHLDSFEVATVQEGEQSVVYRIKLLSSGSNFGAEERSIQDNQDNFNSVIWKRVVLKGLPSIASRPPQYKVLAIQSFANEHSFYVHLSPICRSNGIQVPAVYFTSSNSSSNSNLDDARFEYIMEDFVGWRQLHQLSLHDLKLALRYLARLHATFWRRTSVAQHVFLRGGWWTADKRPPEQLAAIRDHWASCVSNFKFSGPAASDLGGLIMDHLDDVLTFVRDASDPLKSPVTLVHGDFKTGNVLFRHPSTCHRNRRHPSPIQHTRSPGSKYSHHPAGARPDDCDPRSDPTGGRTPPSKAPKRGREAGSESESGSGSDLQSESESAVAAVDWQWCGLGSPCLDVSYLILSSASLDALRHEDDLLRSYYSDLVRFARADRRTHPSQNSNPPNDAVDPGHPSDSDCPGASGSASAVSLSNAVPSDRRRSPPGLDSDSDPGSDPDPGSFDLGRLRRQHRVFVVNYFWVVLKYLCNLDAEACRRNRGEIGYLIQEKSPEHIEWLASRALSILVEMQASRASGSSSILLNPAGVSGK